MLNKTEQELFNSIKNRVELNRHNNKNLIEIATEIGNLENASDELLKRFKQFVDAFFGVEAEFTPTKTVTVRETIFERTR